jgi:hypothetical protein
MHLSIIILKKQATRGCCTLNSFAVLDVITPVNDLIYAVACLTWLQLLASKLGLDASRLVLFCSDSVLAERMWFNPEGLAGLMEFVDGLVAPQSFVSVVQVRYKIQYNNVIHLCG